MSPALSKSLIDILLASGVPSREDATALTANLNGNSWTEEVLNSGKVDEQKFLNAIGDFFNVPVVSVDSKRIDRATLGVLPAGSFSSIRFCRSRSRKSRSCSRPSISLTRPGASSVSQLLDKPAEWVLAPADKSSVP